MFSSSFFFAMLQASIGWHKPSTIATATIVSKHPITSSKEYTVAWFWNKFSTISYGVVTRQNSCRQDTSSVVISFSNRSGTAKHISFPAFFWRMTSLNSQMGGWRPRYMVSFNEVSIKSKISDFLCELSFSYFHLKTSRSCSSPNCCAFLCIVSGCGHTQCL